MELEQLIKENKFDEALSFLAKKNDMNLAIKKYNEAFVYFKNDDFINARFFLEKAKKMGLYSEEVHDALQVVKSKLGIESIENSYYKEDVFMFNSVGFHQDVYFSLIGILLLISLVFFAKAKHFIGVVSLVFCIGLGSFYSVISDHHVKINEQEVSVYAGPSKIFEEVQVLLPGMKVITTHETGKWSFVKYPKVYRGWILNQKAKEL